MTFWAQGVPYGLLQHDMVERFLLHYFAMAYHTYTRGTWTTPEAVHPDRDQGSTDYVAAGVMNAPTYLKWALLYEEPDNRTVWLAKALPRDWLAIGVPAVKVGRATSRYGRVSFSMQAGHAEGSYVVNANVSLPTSYSSAPPPGGLRLRLRAPLQHAGKMKTVTVGGKVWTAFDAKAETVDFTAKNLAEGGSTLRNALQHVVATFS